MKTNGQDISAQILDQAISLGASVAGIAKVDALKNSPSHFVVGKFDRFNGVGTRDPGDIASGPITWPEYAESVVVIGVKHPEHKPELDWWQDGLRGSTLGNRILMDINSKLSDWLEKEKGFITRKLPYHIEKGGIFLKDAAVLAGLGCIGKNNLFISPEYGPRIRLRAILTNAALPSTGAIEFNPCKDCNMPCRTACPQAAFQKKIYREGELGLDKLPGRCGVYSRQLCNVQMEMDIKNSNKAEANEQNTPGKKIKYCRRCEFACPVGKE